ncbi:MAG: GNAT family N-acetyltransferase [Ilumatobacteraceae bacterium]
MSSARPVAIGRLRGGRSGRGDARMRHWPGDETVGHLVLADHGAVPSSSDIDQWIEQAKAIGLRALRTGAMFPRAAEAFADAGFVKIDTLALLEIDLRATRPPSIRLETRRLTRRQYRDAVAIDRRAFGAPWANDAASLAEIRRATPTHRARQLSVDGRLAAFAISGTAGSTGYIQRLAVDPRHQRGGRGKSLVADALCWMHDRHLVNALVNTAVGNVAALALYDQFGFRQRADQLTIAELDLTRRS